MKIDVNPLDLLDDMSQQLQAMSRARAEAYALFKAVERENAELKKQLAEKTP